MKKAQEKIMRVREKGSGELRVMVATARLSYANDMVEKGEASFTTKSFKRRVLKNSTLPERRLFPSTGPSETDRILAKEYVDVKSGRKKFYDKPGLVDRMRQAATNEEAITILGECPLGGSILGKLLRIKERRFG